VLDRPPQGQAEIGREEAQEALRGPRGRRRLLPNSAPRASVPPRGRGGRKATRRPPRRRRAGPSRRGGGSRARRCRSRRASCSSAGLPPVADGFFGIEHDHLLIGRLPGVSVFGRKGLPEPARAFVESIHWPRSTRAHSGPCRSGGNTSAAARLRRSSTGDDDPSFSSLCRTG